MTDILTQLAEAKEGGRELDTIVHYRDPTLIFEGNMVRLPGVGALEHINHKGIPHYSTSLDAALPGENIVSVRYEPASKLWQAWHQDEQGEHSGAEAHTEALARRCAALKGMADG